MFYMTLFFQMDLLLFEGNSFQFQSEHVALLCKEGMLIHVAGHCFKLISMVSFSWTSFVLSAHRK